MSKSIACVVVACLIALAATPASAQVILPSPLLPPGGGDPLVGYLLGDTTWAGGAVMSDPFLSQFDPPPPIITPMPGGDILLDHEATLTAMMDAGSGLVPVTLTGLVQTLVFGKDGNTTGTFDTEILEMRLPPVSDGDAGGIPIRIRESLTLASTGRTTITDIGGGLFEIDSFFDVFTELSTDGGNTFQPQVGGPTRMVLVRRSESEVIPEPATLSLLALGGLGLWRRRRRA